MIFNYFIEIIAVWENVHYYLPNFNLYSILKHDYNMRFEKTPDFAQPKQEAFLWEEEFLFWQCHSSPNNPPWFGCARKCFAEHFGRSRNLSIVNWFCIRKNDKSILAILYFHKQYSIIRSYFSLFFLILHYLKYMIEDIQSMFEAINTFIWKQTINS